MMDLEREMEWIATNMPEGYTLNIHLESGNSHIEIVTPNRHVMELPKQADCTWQVMIQSAYSWVARHFQKTKR